MLLHQTWKTHFTPAEFAAYRRSWLQHNARLTVELHDDVACRQGVANHEPALLPTYDALPASIMRADMVRYVWMRHLGGIYADLDVECTGPVDALLEPGAHVVLEDIRPRQPTIGNALMSSSAPGHPFWRHVLALLVYRSRRLRGFDGLEPERQRGEILWTTGPYMLTDALASWAGAPVTVHEQGTVGAVHHRAGSWWRVEEKACREG